MTPEHLSVAIRTILGNQVQIMLGIATILHNTEHKDFAEITLQQAELTQRLVDGLDRVYGSLAQHDT